MQRSRFTEEQIITVLREQEAGVKTAEVCRKHGVSEATFYKWKAKYGGMDVSDQAILRAELSRAGASALTTSHHEISAGQIACVCTHVCYHVSGMRRVGHGEKHYNDRAPSARDQREA
jgi:putative transposase